MLLLELQLGGVFHGDDAFRAGDGVGQHVEERRLSRAGAARDEDVEPGANGRLEELREGGGQCPELHEIRHPVRIGGEATNGEHGSVEGQGRNDGVHA